MGKKVLYKEPSCDFYHGSKGLTVDQAKELLESNTNNRPRSKSEEETLAREILRGEFELLWDAVAIDKYGDFLNGQTRLHGLLMADEMLKRNPTYYREKYKTKHPLTIDIAVMKGLDPRKVDAGDTGRKRSGAHALFREHRFGKNGEAYTDKELTKMSTILYHATRLVWTKYGGKTVSDAGKLTNTELKVFLSQHPLLVDAVKFVFDENKGEDSINKKGAGMPLQYAAGFLYLFAFSDYTRAQLDAGDVDVTQKPKLWGKAEKFLTLFASATTLEGKDVTIHYLRELLAAVDSKSSAKSRQYCHSLLAKAWDKWINNETPDNKKDISPKLKGREKIVEVIGVGGWDVDTAEIETDKPTCPEVVGEYRLGQSVWCVDKDDPAAPWEGPLRVLDPKGKKHGVEYDGEVYFLSVNLLSATKPDMGDWQPQPEESGEDSDNSEQPFLIEENGEWWVAGVPAYEVDGETYNEYGPYDTEEKAQQEFDNLLAGV